MNKPNEAMIIRLDVFEGSTELAIGREELGARVLKEMGGLVAVREDRRREGWKAAGSHQKKMLSLLLL